MSEKKDYKFVVTAFDGQDTAEQVLERIREIKKNGNFKLEDMVAITKNEKGKVKLKQGRSLTGVKGTLGFGTAGLIAGAILGGPIVGAVIGAALGSAGSQIKKEFNNANLKELGQELDMDSSMLVLLISDAEDGALEAVVDEFGGKMHAFVVAEEGLIAMNAITEDEAFATVIEKEIEIIEETEEDIEICPECGTKTHDCNKNDC